jgi:hypothetical protein
LTKYYFCGILYFMSDFEKIIESPALEDLGAISSALDSYIEKVALDAVENPGYVEVGRHSRRVSFDGNKRHDTLLHELAIEVGKEYLGIEPAPGSTAVISTVIDANTYAKHTQDSKAASHWHQDFVDTERGFFFPDPTARRLIIPMLAGTLEAVGTLSFLNPIIIPSVEPPEISNRVKALNMGVTVMGADGVLMKSEIDPLGGEIIEAEANRAYLIPHNSVHKTNPVLPKGRIFFQLDTQVN